MVVGALYDRDRVDLHVAQLVNALMDPFLAGPEVVVAVQGLTV
jgi:hypothetical protein